MFWTQKEIGYVFFTQKKNTFAHKKNVKNGLSKTHKDLIKKNFKSKFCFLHIKFFLRYPKHEFLHFFKPKN